MTNLPLANLTTEGLAQLMEQLLAEQGREAVCEALATAFEARARAAREAGSRGLATSLTYSAAGARDLAA